MKAVFKKIDGYFKNNNFEMIDNEKHGVRYLKLRSISRTELLEQFCEENKISIEGVSKRSLFEDVFCDNSASIEDIDLFIKKKYKEERKKRKDNETYLIDQLSRLKVFDWGGSKGNSLEKNIVDNYVKKITSYDKINDEIKGSLLASLRGYTLNSWYNHWTSILIEDIFKDHNSILPTVGLIKKVDFFIGNIPFDLKVTYFPEQLMKEKLRNCKFGNELTETKKICRQLKISIPDDLKDEDLKEHLQDKLKEHKSSMATEFLQNLRTVKMRIIEASQKNPEELNVWLYENQGEMRFDASNRFFLILVDKENISESWKLKRNIAFLKKEISTHLDKLKQNMSSLDTKFKWEKDGKEYRCKSDILFVLG